MVAVSGRNLAHNRPYGRHALSYTETLHAEDRTASGSTRHHTVLALRKNPSHNVANHHMRAPSLVVERTTGPHSTETVRQSQATGGVPHRYCPPSSLESPVTQTSRALQLLVSVEDKAGVPLPHGR